MSTCAECRFWKRDKDGEPYGVFDGGPSSVCEHPRDKMRYAGNESGLIWTNCDFGCVQFEPLPIPESMPVIFVGEGEYVEPIPGHRFGPIYFKRAQPIGSGPVPDVTAHKIAINDQWFEIRPKPVVHDGPGIEPGTYDMNTGKRIG